jgi:hypothetical protein
VGYVCSRLTVDYGLVGSVNATGALGPMVKAFFAIDRAQLTLVASVAFRSAPRLTGALIADDLGGVVLAFDQEVDAGGNAGDAGIVNCSRLVEGGGLGERPLCVWTSPAILAIRFGSSATLRPGDAVRARPGIRSQGPSGITSHDTQVVLADPPLQPVAPSIVLSGPAMLAGCDSALIRAEVSAARSVVAWGCLDDDGINMLLRNRTGETAVLIPGMLLASGRSYTISAWTEALGYRSDAALHTISRSDTPVPPLVVSFPPGPLLRSHDNVFVAYANYSACGSTVQVANFTWVISEALSAVNGSGITHWRRLVLQAAGTFLHLPSALLRPGGVYIVTVTASLPSESVAVVTTSFTVNSEPLVAIIAGGNRLAAPTSAVRLDASASYDPDACGAFDFDGMQPRPAVCDTVVPLAFAWDCRVGGVGGLPCRSSNGSLIALGSTPIVTVQLNGIDTDGASALLFTVAVTNPGRSARDSVLVTLAEGTSLDVQLARVYSNAEGIALKALLAASASAAVLRWQVQRTDAARGSFSLPDTDSATLSAGDSQRNFVLRLDTPWASRCLSHPLCQPPPPFPSFLLSKSI